jgi:precorrin-2 dehydrogenase / sirohydrochlorin ferrochelatase
MRSLPLAVRLEGKSCLSIGAGVVAARRVPALLEAGAVVTVVAPDPHSTIRTLVEAGRCAYRARPYVDDDCLGMFLVLVATGLPEVDAAAAAAAHAQGALVCVASNPSLGNCLFMATVRRGPLVVALHTEGAAPAVSAALRRSIDAQLPARLGDTLDSLGRIRAELRASVGDPAERALRWRMVVESGALDRLLARADPSVLEEVRGLLIQDAPRGSPSSAGGTIAEQSEYI